MESASIGWVEPEETIRPAKCDFTDDDSLFMYSIIQQQHIIHACIRSRVGTLRPGTHRPKKATSEGRILKRKKNLVGTLHAGTHRLDMKRRVCPFLFLSLCTYAFGEFVPYSDGYRCICMYESSVYLNPCWQVVADKRTQ